VSANLELVRSIYSARERGDFSSAEWAHPDIEFILADGPNPGRWVGIEGLGQVMREWASAFQGMRSEAVEFRALDEERVLVLFKLSGRGKRSGLELEQLGAQSATLYYIRDGKVIKVITYWNRERALAELGLASEADISSA
jgi:ketosteroid isomerase-like protein